MDRGGALTRTHRYALAAELCAGLDVVDVACGVGDGTRVIAGRAGAVVGVDASPAAVAAARELSAGIATFECAEPPAYLRAHAQAGAVVVFDAPDPAALVGELVRLRQGGARVLLSVPNAEVSAPEDGARALAYEDLLALIAPLLEATVLEQRGAQASVIRPAGAESPGEAVVDGAAEAEWADSWIVLSGVPEDEVAGARALLAAAVSADDNRTVHALERANDELRRANAQLGRGSLGRHDAAAAAIIRPLEERAEAAEEALRHAEKEVERRQEMADANDWARRVAERKLERARYRVVDAARDRFVAVPVLGAAAQGVWHRWVHRRGPGLPAPPPKRRND